jgi:general secretion pathway protein N
MSKKNLFKWPFVLGLICYFCFLVAAKTPAHWAAWVIQKNIPNAGLTSVNGSLWRGTAGSFQIEIGKSIIPLGRLKWQLSPLSLISLSPCVEFSTSLPAQHIEGEFCSGMSGENTIKSLKVDAPIEVIQELLPIQANGAISLQVMNAKFNDLGHVKEFDGRFSWQNAKASFDASRSKDCAPRSPCRLVETKRYKR